MESEIRHCGIFVYDIEWVSSVLEKLNFISIYDDYEIFNKIKRRIKKYKLDNLVVELIQGISFYKENCFHISLTMDVPFFMLNDRSYNIKKYKNPNDPSLEVTFVYINDSLYFEFVKEKV